MAASLSITTSSSSPLCLSTKLPQRSRGPSGSLSFSTGSRPTNNFSLNTTSATSPLLHSSFLSSSLSFPSSSFSGYSLGFDFNNSSIGTRKEKGAGLVVRAGKAALCQTKRNRSRKSLARTHGFRRRMRTTTGRAILKRRRAKGRWVLCTKSNPNSGKAS